ncbi:hypothetical protein [Streptomyces sp. SID14478]|uniref:hypothetical protein n=1 Tax=Streptomyces sp. SID14478 TaxID=2706073 RepID=UPI0013DD7B90|nr:hypothetical protein [Streptomyces sp. SID14478]
MTDDTARGTWGLMLSCLGGGVGGVRMTTRPVGHVTGTRREAGDALLRHVSSFEPRHPLNLVRRTVYEQGDGYLVIAEGMTQTFEYAFRLARVVHDTRPDLPMAPPQPAAPPPPVAPPSY